MVAICGFHNIYDNNDNDVKERKSWKSERYFVSVSTSAILIVLG